MKKKDSWLLITYSDNWADEMDVEGYRIFNTDEWNSYCKSAKMEFKENGSYTYYIGTNEEIEYESYTDFMKCFEVKEVSDKDMDILEKLELDGGIGFFPENIGLDYAEDKDGE